MPRSTRSSSSGITSPVTGCRRATPGRCSRSGPSLRAALRSRRLLSYLRCATPGRLTRAGVAGDRPAPRGSAAPEARADPPGGANVEHHACVPTRTSTMTSPPHRDDHAPRRVRQAHPHGVMRRRPRGGTMVVVSRDDERLTWVGHATVLLELGGARLLTDPLLRTRLGHLRRHGARPAPEVTEDIDAVLVSHVHLDHLDVRSLRSMARGARVIAPARRRDGCCGASASPRSTRSTPGDSVTVGGATITALPAVHDGRRRPLGAAVATLGYEIVGAQRVYFAGDTELFEGMRELRRALRRRAAARLGLGAVARARAHGPAGRGARGRDHPPGDRRPDPLGHVLPGRAWRRCAAARSSSRRASSRATWRSSPRRSRSACSLPATSWRWVGSPREPGSGGPGRRGLPLRRRPAAHARVRPLRPARSGQRRRADDRALRRRGDARRRGAHVAGAGRHAPAGGRRRRGRRGRRRHHSGLRGPASRLDVRGDRRCCSP